MGFDRTAPKRPVNVTLNEDPVQRARGVTSSTEAKDADQQRQINDHIMASDAFIAKHGTIADEFNTL
jgi:L-lactate utilization protein LutC